MAEEQGIISKALSEQFPQTGSAPLYSQSEIDRVGYETSKLGQVVDLEALRQSKTFFEKWDMASRDWEDNTWAGGVYKYATGQTVNPNDYEEDKNWSGIGIKTAQDMAMSIGGTQQDVENFITAKNQEHLSALYKQAIVDANKHRLINETLTSSEREVAGMIFYNADFDMLFSMGVTAFPKIALSGFKTANNIAIASGTLAVTKPFAREAMQNTGAKFSDLAFESILGGAIEGVAIKYLSPELKQSVSKIQNNVPSADVLESVSNSSKSLVDNAVTFEGELRPQAPKGLSQSSARGVGVSAEDKLIEEFKNTSVDDIAKGSNLDADYVEIMKDELNTHLETSGELLKKDEEFMSHMNNKDYDSALGRAEEIASNHKNSGIKMPKPKELDSVAKAIDMIEEDLIRTTNGKFDSDLFNAELHSYTQGSKQFSQFMDGLKNYIGRFSEDIEKVSNVVKGLKGSVDDIFKEMGGVIGLSSRQSKVYKDYFHSLVDDFIETAKSGSSIVKSEKESLDSFITTLKNDVAKLKDYVEPQVKTMLEAKETMVARLQSEYDRLVSILGSNKSVVVDGKTITKKDVSEKAKALKEAKQELKSSTKEAFATVEAEVRKELGSRLTLKREGNVYKLGSTKLGVGMAIGTFGASGAFANTAEGDIAVSSLSSLLLLAGVSGIGYKLFKSGALGKTVSSMFDKSVDNAGKLKTSFVAHKKMLNALRDDVMFLRSGWNETFAPVKKYAERIGNSELLDFVKKTIFNGTQGEASLVEGTRSNIIHTYLPQYIREERPLYEEWSKANGINIAQRVASYLGGEPTMYNFRKFVSMAEAGLEEMIPQEGKEFVLEMAKRSKDIKNKILDEAIASGVEGADKVQKLEKYLTRRYASNMREIIMGMDEQSLVSFKQMFLDMHLSALTKMRGGVEEMSSSLKKVMDKLEDIETFKTFMDKNSNVFKAVIEEDEELTELYGKMESASNIKDAKIAYLDFADAVSHDAMIERATIRVDKYIDDLAKNGYANEISDILSPLKRRIPLDLSKFRATEAVIDGEKRTLEIDNIFNMSNFDLFEKYVNGFAGRIGFANAGIKMSDMKTMIENIADKDMQQVVKDYTDTLLGIPVVNITDKQAMVMQGLMNVASARLLFTSPVALIMEATMATARGIMHGKEGVAMAKTIYSMFKEAGEDSFLHHSIAEGFGFGVGSKMGGAHIRGEALDIVDSSVTGSSVVNLTKNYRDLVMNTKGTGISWWSDIIEKINLNANIQRLSDIAKGETKVGKVWMDKYGISEADFEFINKYLQTNEKGFVKYFNPSDMPYADRYKLHNILFNMNQFGAQRSTIGSTPHFAYSSSIGSAFMKLMSYTVNSVSNIGAPMMKGIALGDKDAIVGMSALLVGGYLSGRARTALMGRKEKTEQEYWNYALMQLPMTAPISMGMALANPTVPAGVASIGNDFRNVSAFAFGR